MCKCLETAGDEYDNTVLFIVGHRPECPEFKIDKHVFAKNLKWEAERIAEAKFKNQIEIYKAGLISKARKTTKTTESKIQVRLFHHLNQKGHVLIAPTVQVFHTGEMDICSVMKSGKLNEYEIKLSRGDFKKDFKKLLKHRVLSRQEISWKNYEGKIIPYSLPNYFYYVCPTDLIAAEEIPDYAGLIYFDPKFTYDFKTVVKAKQLHKDPITDVHRNYIKRTLMWRCWTAREKVEQLQEQINK